MMNNENASAYAESAALAKAQLSDDFKVVLTDAEALLKATLGQGGEALTAARGKIEGSIAVARAGMAEAQAALATRTRAAARATDVYIHRNPWQAIAISAGVGLVVGWLAGRR